LKAHRSPVARASLLAGLLRSVAEEQEQGQAPRGRRVRSWRSFRTRRLKKPRTPLGDGPRTSEGLLWQSLGLRSLEEDVQERGPNGERRQVSPTRTRRLDLTYAHPGRPPRYEPAKGAIRSILCIPDRASGRARHLTEKVEFSQGVPRETPCRSPARSEWPDDVAPLGRSPAPKAKWGGGRETCSRSCAKSVRPTRPTTIASLQISR